MPRVFAPAVGLRRTSCLPLSLPLAAAPCFLPVSLLAFTTHLYGMFMCVLAVKTKIVHKLYRGGVDPVHGVLCGRAQPGWFLL